MSKIFAFLMDVNNFLTILGLIVTLLVGYLGIRYAFKFRNKVSITFIRRECFSLFNTIVKNLEEIEIKFKNQPITQNLILLKGTFILVI